MEAQDEMNTMLKEENEKLRIDMVNLCSMLETVINDNYKLRSYTAEKTEDFKKILQLTNENDSETVRILNASLGTLRDENKLIMMKLQETGEDLKSQKDDLNDHHGGMKNKQLQIKKMEEDHNEAKAQLKVEVEKVRSLKQRLDKLKAENESVKNENLEWEMKVFNLENDQHQKALHDCAIKNAKDYDQEIDN